MEDVIDDIFVAICSKLSSRGKIRLLSCCKKLNSKQQIIYYDDVVDIREIIYCKMYHNFTQIMISEPLQIDDKKYYCGCKINQCSLPKNVKILLTSYPVKIPYGVIELYFTEYFNWSIRDTIPDSVRLLDFGDYFDNEIIGHIPNGVIKIKFGDRFNHPIVDTVSHICAIPDSVTKLEFGLNFDKDIFDYVSKNLKKLVLGARFNRRKRPVPEVKTLILNGNNVADVNLTIPTSVTTLKINYDGGYLPQGFIPNTVRKLFIKGCGIQQNSIPYGVTHLKFGERFNSSVIKCIPDSIIELEFGHAFDKSIKKAIPFGVQKIIFGDKFSCQLKDNIPASVTHVTLGKFSERRKNEIPHVKNIEIRKSNPIVDEYEDYDESE